MFRSARRREGVSDMAAIIHSGVCGWVKSVSFDDSRNEALPNSIGEAKADEVITVNTARARQVLM
jgi:hypothetical protein